MSANLLRLVAAAALSVILAVGCSSGDPNGDGADVTPAAPAAASQVSPSTNPTPEEARTVEQTIELSSSVFSRIRRIPLKNACTEMKDIARPTTDSTVKKSENASPPLSWTGLPEGTKSVTLIVDGTDNVVDPKSPDEPLAVHWLIWNIPPSVTELSGAVATTTNPVDVVQQVVQGVTPTAFTATRDRARRCRPHILSAARATTGRRPAPSTSSTSEYTPWTSSSSWAPTRLARTY